MVVHFAMQGKTVSIVLTLKTHVTEQPPPWQQNDTTINTINE